LQDYVCEKRRSLFLGKEKRGGGVVMQKEKEVKGPADRTKRSLQQQRTSSTPSEEKGGKGIAPATFSSTKKRGKSYLYHQENRG